MVKDRISFNSKKRVIAVATASLLVVSIAAIGAAPLSDQQTSSSSLRIGRGVITSSLIADETIVSADLKDGAAVRSSDIVDGQVNTADLADDAITSEKIRDGEVKAEDLDPGIELGGGSTPSFSLQVTERSNALTVAQEDAGYHTVSVQCNSDEVVTGGGSEADLEQGQGNILEASKKLDNGWTATWFKERGTITVYAECLKVVNEGAAG